MIKYRRESNSRVRRSLAAFAAGALGLTMLLSGGVGAGAANGYVYTEAPPIPVPNSGAPYAVAVDQVNHLVYVLDVQLSKLLILDETTNAFVASVNVKYQPSAVAIDPLLHRAYVTSTPANRVQIIETLTYTVLGEAVVSKNPQSVAVDPQTHNVYVGSNAGRSLDVVNGITGVVTNTFAVGYAVGGIAVDPGSQRLLVADRTNSAVHIYNVEPNQFNQTQLIQLGSDNDPNAVAIDTTNHLAFVASGQQSVSIVNIIDGSKNDLVFNSDHPDLFQTVLRTVTVDESSHIAYVNDLVTGRNYAIDGPTHTLLNTFQGDVGAYGIAVDFNTHRIYMSSIPTHAIVYFSRSDAPRATSVTSVSGSGQTAAAGSAFGSPLVAQVTDQNGAALPSATVTFSVSSGSATFPGAQGSAQVTADDQGRATSPPLTAGNSPGAVTIDATAAGASSSATFAETVTAAPNTTPPTLDSMTTGYQSRPVQTFASAPFSTGKAGELVVALVQAGGPADGTQNVTQVSGGSLDWFEAGAVNAPGRGAVEIWQAYAYSKLNKIPIRATLATPAAAAITVRAYNGAATDLGAISVDTGAKGPSAETAITPQASNSLLVATGFDRSSATKPKPASSQPLTSYFLNATAKTAAWTQAVATPTQAGASVNIRAAIPAADAWSTIAAEVPAAQPADMPS